MKMMPYWLDTAPRFASGAEGPVEGRADVVVIGGGFTGLSAALALAQKGASVVLLEAGRVCGESSGRNGGHVNNGTAHDFAGLSGLLGLDRARGLYHAFDAAVDTVERIVAEQRIDCSFQRNGKIKLAAKPQHYEKIARGFDLLHREADPDTALIPPERIRDEIGSDQFFGGLVFRKSAQMHVGRFGHGLAEATHRAGARIFENAAVRGIHRVAEGHRVESARGAVVAKQVFVAGGVGRGAGLWFRRRVIPVGSFIIVTQPLDQAQLDSIMPTRRNGTTTKNIGNYFRITPDDRLVWGGRARFAMSSPSADAKSGRLLEARLHQVFPQLGRVRIDYCWGCTMDVTQDRLPRAGEQDGIFYAMGYSGHGVQMSVHMGQQMAQVLDGKPEANPLAGLDWPAIPGHFGPPWFMPIVGVYYRIQDILH